MRIRSGEWIGIERQLSVKELEVLFTIPYSSYISTLEIYKRIGRSTFYKFMDYFVAQNLLDKSSETSNNGKKTSIYKRNFRLYRVRNDRKGKIIIEVSP